MKKSSPLSRVKAILAAALGISFTGCSVSLPSPHGGLHHDPTPTMVPKGRMKTEANAAGDAELLSKYEMIGDFSHTLTLPDGSNLIASIEGSELYIENYDNGQPEFEDRGFRGGLEWKRLRPREGDPERYPAAWTFGVGYGRYPGFVDYVDAHAGYGFGGRMGKVFTPFFAGMAGASVPVWRKTFDYTYPTWDDVITDTSVIAEDERTRYRYTPALWVESLIGMQTDFGLKQWGPRAYLAYGFRYFLMLQKDDMRMDEEDRNHGLAGLGGAFKCGLSWVY